MFNKEEQVELDVARDMLVRFCLVLGVGLLCLAPCIGAYALIGWWPVVASRLVPFVLRGQHSEANRV